VKLASIRNSLVGSAFVVLASMLLSSCGGGGAGSPGPVGGPPQIQPEAGPLYGGVEYTFTLGGGRAPYFLSSSEPSLLPVPQSVTGSFFNVTPANPGVIDNGLAPTDLPVRSVVITSRDSIGNTVATTGIRVAINFMTGYGVKYNSNCATTGTSTTPPAACAGGETAVTLTATINGNLMGNRAYRFDVVRGPFTWTFPNGQLQGGTISNNGNTVTTNTDHVGDAHVFFKVNTGVATQLGVYRVTDVATGASQVFIFTINGTQTLSGTLTAIPSSLSFTGPTTAQCGTGAGDVLVFDGVPPYRATSTDSNVQVTPDRSDEQPGRFRVAATNPFVCLANATVVITDANNSRATVTVTTEAGSTAPPPSPISVTPGQISLGCGTSGSVSVLGGSSGSTGTTSQFSVSSSDPRVTATVTGRTVTIGRLGTDPAGTTASPTPGIVNPINYSVTVTDGSSSTAVGVSAPSNCPP
jgi:hypothetical protein